MKKIHILGRDGVTGKSLQKVFQKLNITEVEIEDADVIVTSPGINPKDFPNTDKEIISEIEFTYRLLKIRNQMPIIIAVTGTNGKSTVVSMLSYVLNCPATGNIGRPFCEILLENVKDKPVVVEISSYQLETCTTFKPKIAVCLNITEDHLQRHNTMEEYAKQKAKIFQNTDSDDYVIFDQENNMLTNYINKLQSNKIPISMGTVKQEVKPLLNLPGLHNQINTWVVIKIANLLNKSNDEIYKKINTFTPLEHRIEWVAKINGVDFYNDSKATNPDATVVAVEAFEQPITLLLCGFDKGLRLEKFWEFISNNVERVIVFGDIKKRIVEVSKFMSPNFNITEVNTIDEAINSALKQSNKGDMVLFSPSCSSFDQFKSFEDRGEKFKKYVHDLERVIHE